MSILLAVKHAQLDHHNAKQMARIAQDTATSDTPIRTAKGATAGGDERKARGVPIQAKGIGGVIPGTSPHQMQWLRHERD